MENQESTAEKLQKQTASRSVKIYVGPEKKEWTLPEDFVCDASDFFKKAFKSSFEENAGILELPEDEPAAFDLFVKWVYDSPRDHRIWKTKPSMFSVRDYLGVYVFASKYHIPRLRTDAVEAIYGHLFSAPQGRLSWAEYKPDPDHLAYITDNVPGVCGMKSLLVFHALAYLIGRKGKEGLPDRWRTSLMSRPDMGVDILDAICRIDIKDPLNNGPGHHSWALDKYLSE